MNIHSHTNHLTASAMLLALCIAVSWLESLLPPLSFLPPGVKLGLANIVTMYCLFFIGYREAIIIVLLKSLFVFLTRGFTAGLLSGCGSLLSILVLIIIQCTAGPRVSYRSLSVLGAVFHNMGQLLAVSLLMSSTIYVYYIPVLIISGVIMGLLTGTLLRFIMPALQRITHH